MKFRLRLQGHGFYQGVLRVQSKEADTSRDCGYIQTLNVWPQIAHRVHRRSVCLVRLYRT